MKAYRNIIMSAYNIRKWHQSVAAHQWRHEHVGVAMAGVIKRWRNGGGGRRIMWHGVMAAAARQLSGGMAAKYRPWQSNGVYQA